MSIPKNITKEHLIKAITKIDTEGVPQNGNSRYYDVTYHGKKYPPKVIISYANIFANGNELNRDLFTGGEDEASFKLLKENGFQIEKKLPKEPHPPIFWIEKTHVRKREDRKTGDRALGLALWSPQKGKGGSDIYKNMRNVKKGDIVLHLIDNEDFAGISKVKKEFIETTGLENTPWDRPSYLIELKDYVELNPKINRSKILNIRNKNLLESISINSEVFYNNILNLREGAYLTPCPYELLQLINELYKKTSGKNLPYTDHINFEKIKSPKMIHFEIKLLASSLAKANLLFSDMLVSRFTASLLTKPFVILTGLSGSGKTKLAQAFAMWMCEDESQYCIVPVGADWTNREPLLGFPNALEKEQYIAPDNRTLDIIIEANKNSEKPYFLILDEMNLSHVERYFADFLSVMETKRKISLHSGSTNWNDIPSEIGIPKNLFIIGTVNIDETTYMFSPKVLDRANVIEFRVTAEEMENYLKSIAPVKLENLAGLGALMARGFVNTAKDESIEIADSVELNSVLMSFFTELKKTGAEFGYRSASEIHRFAGVVNKTEPSWTISDIIDAAIMQKLLPKVHGSRRKLEPVLKTLGTLCLTEGQKLDDYIKAKDPALVKYPVSLEKILRMYDNLISNGFTSYAEA